MHGENGLGGAEVACREPRRRDDERNRRGQPAEQRDAEVGG